MNIDARTIKASPFVGVLGLLTDEFALLPLVAEKKELRGLEHFLGVPVIKGNLAQSSLIGVLALGLGSKIALSELVEAREVKELEKNGLDVFVLQGVTALGNLVALNEKGGIASPMLSAAQVKQLEDFFKIKLGQHSVVGSDVPGATIVATSKGFIVHPLVSEKELSLLEEMFNVHGVPTTANYGDRFVGNSVLANKKAVIVGVRTSGIELARIDEGLRGD